MNEYCVLCLTREVWPDDVFGAQDMDTNEQRDVIKKIFLDPVSGMCLSAYVYLCLCSSVYMSVCVHVLAVLLLTCCRAHVCWHS